MARQRKTRKSTTARGAGRRRKTALLARSAVRRGSGDDAMKRLSARPRNDMYAAREGGERRSKRSRGTLHATFDAARTNADNRRDWIHADELSGDAAADADVRRILRKRSNYEAVNNPHLDCQLNTLGNDVIGARGPNPQFRTSDEKLNAAAEREFRRWARAAKLSQKLRLLRKTRGKRGETLGLLFFNPEVDHPVKLDIQLIEGDQCATPDLWVRGLQRDNRFTDGIEFDAYNNPAFYHILHRHPGDVRNLVDDPIAYDRVPAADVLHYFRSERPGQRRGYPETTSGLTLYRQRRQFRGSTLDAAESQAHFAVLLKSTATPDENQDAEAFDEIDLPRRTGLTLPPGIEPTQLKPEHPNTTFAEFDSALVSEAGRALQMPRNISTGDSSGYNYASNRSDIQPYNRANEVDQDDLDLDVLWKILARWCVYANAVPGLLPASGRRLLPVLGTPRRRFEYDWFWTEREHSDPLKEANAIGVRLKTRTTTLATEYAKQGKDWRDEVEQMGAEQQALAAAGLANGEPLSGPALAAALDVLSKLRDGTIVPLAATELLASVGVPRGQAEKMVAATPAERNDSADDIEFKRQLILKAVTDKTLADLIFNIVATKGLLKQVNVPVDPGAPDTIKPPIVADDGTRVDPEGNPLDVSAAPVKTDPVRNGHAQRNGAPKTEAAHAP